MYVCITWLQCNTVFDRPYITILYSQSTYCMCLVWASSRIGVALSSWKLIILRASHTGDFARNSIVNPPCRSSYVDEFINIGVYTFIPYTTREVSRPLIVTPNT